MKYNRHILDDQKNYKNLENFGEKRKKKAVSQLSNHKGSRRIITSSLEDPIQCLQNLSYFVPSVDTTGDSVGQFSKSRNTDVRPTLPANNQSTLALVRHTQAGCESH